MSMINFVIPEISVCIHEERISPDLFILSASHLSCVLLWAQSGAVLNLVRFRHVSNQPSVATTSDSEVQASALLVELHLSLNKHVNSSLCSSGGTASGLCGLSPAAGLHCSVQLRKKTAAIIVTGQIHRHV